MSNNAISLSLNPSTSLSPLKNETYRLMRRELISIMKKMNTKLSYASSTFYLSMAYLDIIAESIPNEEEAEDNMIDYHLLALSCLSLASKYNEKDPLVSKLDLICSAMCEVTKNRHLYSIGDLKRYELFSIKKLKYRLHYSTLYDFVLFFFTHGILLEHQLITILSYDSIKKYLENVYIYSRNTIDKIMEDRDIVLKYSTIDLSIAAIKHGITMAFGSKFGDLTNCFDVIFRHCYSYDMKHENNATQRILKPVIESLMPNKEDNSQKPQPNQQVIEADHGTAIKTQEIVNQHKRHLSNVKNPNIFSLISPSNKQSTNHYQPLNLLMKQVKSSNNNILDKTKRLFGKQLLLDNITLQDIPRTIIINNNININIQRQISSAQLKPKRNNDRGLEYNENSRNNKQRIIEEINHSTRLINKNIDLYNLIYVNSNTTSTKAIKRTQVKHCNVNLE